MLQNVGTVRNTGLELAVGITPLRSSAMTWHAQLLYSRNRNQLAALGAGVVPDTAAGLVEGYALYGRWVHPIAGFADANGDGVLQPTEVAVGSGFVYRGQLQPKYTLALVTDVALFHKPSGAGGHGQLRGRRDAAGPGGAAGVGAPAGVRQSGAPLAAQAVAVAATRSTDPSAYGLVHRLATLRFTALSVSYRAPAGIARFLRAQQLSVAVQGANLGLHSTYGGRDPNEGSWTPSESVVDRGQLPLPRLWQLAVRLTYGADVDGADAVSMGLRVSQTETAARGARPARACWREPRRGGPDRRRARQQPIARRRRGLPGGHRAAFGRVVLFGGGGGHYERAGQATQRNVVGAVVCSWAAFGLLPTDLSEGRRDVRAGDRGASAGDGNLQSAVYRLCAPVGPETRDE